MRDLILEAFGDREQVNFTHIMDYCLHHSVELRVPLSPLMHRDEILFHLLNDIDDLEAEGLIRVRRYRGFIQSVRRIHAMPGVQRVQ
jgi:hypothetical protein